LQLLGHLGAALAGLNKHKDAIEWFDKAIELDPLNPGFWYNKAKSLKALDHTAEAEATFSKAKELGYMG
jgi:tetratricopeptide (TPR) repeat protein